MCFLRGKIIHLSCHFSQPLKKKAIISLGKKYVNTQIQTSFCPPTVSSWRAGPAGLAHLVPSCPTQSWAQIGSRQTLTGRGCREERRRKCHLGKGFLDNPHLYDQPYLSFSTWVKLPLLWREWRAEVKLPGILPLDVSFQSGLTPPQSNRGPGQRDSGRA